MASTVVIDSNQAKDILTRQYRAGGGNSRKRRYDVVEKDNVLLRQGGNEVKGCVHALACPCLDCVVNVCNTQAAGDIGRYQSGEVVRFVPSFWRGNNAPIRGRLQAKELS